MNNYSASAVCEAVTRIRPTDSVADIKVKVKVQAITCSRNLDKCHSLSTFKKEEMLWHTSCLGCLTKRKCEG